MKKSEHLWNSFSSVSSRESAFGRGYMRGVEDERERLRKEIIEKFNPSWSDLAINLLKLTKPNETS